jgi:hypothetical protein
MRNVAEHIKVRKSSKKFEHKKQKKKHPVDSNTNKLYFAEIIVFVVILEICGYIFYAITVF